MPFHKITGLFFAYVDRLLLDSSHEIASYSKITGTQDFVCLQNIVACNMSGSGVVDLDASLFFLL